VPGLHATLERRVIAQAHPFLGICVGMQLMATRGLEFETTDGLNWIPGDVTAITPNDPAFKIPHMGWNTLDAGDTYSSTQPVHPLLAKIATGPTGLHAYFVHSYHLNPTNPSHVLATTQYGGTITAMVARDNLAGTQFHPEKSQTLGLQLLANFLTWQP
jgi:imidazole glycerol-phosphate synthase subunit HisH